MSHQTINELIRGSKKLTDPKIRVFGAAAAAAAETVGAKTSDRKAMRNPIQVEGRPGEVMTGNDSEAQKTSFSHASIGHMKVEIAGFPITDVKLQVFHTVGFRAGTPNQDQNTGR